MSAVKLVIAATAASVGIAAAALAASYQYDALGRLTMVTHDDGAEVTYSYDANGNRTSVAVVDAAGSPPSVSGFVVVPLNGYTLIPLQ